MDLALRIALSFMRRRSSRWPSFTSLVSVLGISFGVAAFLVVITVFNSFEGELKRILLSANPHLMIFADGDGIPNARQYADEVRTKIEKSLKTPIESVSLAEYWEGVLGHGPQTAAVSIRGLEGNHAANARELARVVEPPGAYAALGEFSVPDAAPLPVILGKGLAEKISAKVGSRLSLATAGRDGKERSAALVVVGILSLGLTGYDERLALMGFDAANALFGKEGYARCIEIRFKDPDDAQAAAAFINPESPFIIRPWQQIDQNLFQQIERDGLSVKIIVMIITIVAAFNILTTLSLNVADRTRQIALLRSIGASRGLVLRVFVTMGLLLGVCGAVLGVGMGFAILRVFQGFELGELKATYFFERIPVAYDFLLMLQAMGVAVVLAFVSSLYPAWKAIRVEPLQGLKHGYQ